MTDDVDVDGVDGRSAAVRSNVANIYKLMWYISTTVIWWNS